MEQRPEVAPLVARVSEVISGRLESLAAEAGVSYHTLYAWGTGRRNVSSAQLIRLADAVERRSVVLAALAEELRETARMNTAEADTAR
jgi:hypothetical protein